MIPPRVAVVLASIPTDPALLRADLRPLASGIIERHGLEEWQAALLTHEFHRHLGIYSLLGVKMGVRAREVLEASLDELSVVSHTGLRPPLSCLTDGLQVATGASLGRGTIAIEAGSARPAAHFTKGARRLGLALRPAVSDRVQAAIRMAGERHGARTPECSLEIRRLALSFWLELDRARIFEERIE